MRNGLECTEEVGEAENEMKREVIEVESEFEEESEPAWESRQLTSAKRKLDTLYIQSLSQSQKSAKVKVITDESYFFS